MTPRDLDWLGWAILAAAVVAAVVLILATTGCQAPLPGYGVPR